MTVETVRNICARFLGGEQNEQRFRRRDQNVRRLFQHPRAFRMGVSPVRTAVRMGIRGMPSRFGQSGDFRQRQLQIPMHVVAERFQRRDINDLGFMRQRSCARREPVDRDRSETPREFCRIRWARRSACRVRQRFPASRALGLGGRQKMLREPLPNEWIKERQ